MVDPCRRPIRQLASSRAGALIAAAELGGVVHIWDVGSRQFVRSLYTPLDFGGERLAISEDGLLCVVGAYNSGGVACYAIETGEELWRRGDISHPQNVSITPDDARVVVGADSQSFVLNRADGTTIQTARGVRRIVESPWGDAVFLGGSRMKLTSVQGHARILPRLTFAELGVAFSPLAVCISESGGPIRCWDLIGGTELWRYFVKGHHAIQLCCSRSENVFFGLDLEYEREGKCQLLRFDPEKGQASIVVAPGNSRVSVFCLDGRDIISSDGTLIETMTGEVSGQLWTQ